MFQRLLLAAAFVGVPTLTRAATIDFEGLIPGTTLTNQFQASDSIVFLQNAVVINLGAGHATSGVLGIFNGGATITAEFTLPGGQAAVTNSVSVKGDLIPIAGNVVLQGFDLNGNLIATSTVPDSPAPALLSISIPGIHRIALSSQSNTVAFDDLAFNTPVDADVNQVPEPASISLVLAGGLSLFLLRRRSLP